MATAPVVPDRIQKQVLLHAPRERVWRALTDSREFGAWFGMQFTEPFTAGATLRGVIVPTTVDPEVARQQQAYAGAQCEITIDRVEPQRLFSFRWHPGAVDPSVDYAKEPSTLVTFELVDAEDGILLTVTETGFENVPLARRAQAFAGNEHGWAMQMTLIERYLAQTP